MTHNATLTMPLALNDTQNDNTYDTRDDAESDFDTQLTLDWHSTEFSTF
jgi:hypothetical protein